MHYKLHFQKSIFKERLVVIDHLPQRPLCMLVKMMTILDDSLAHDSFSSTEFSRKHWTLSQRFQPQIKLTYMQGQAKKVNLLFAQI